MKKNQKKLYPLKFVPFHSEHPWGDENWNIISLGSISSEVSDGFLAENNLDDILETYLGDLVGDSIFDLYNLYFPVTVKVADMKGQSSLQVHPDDEVGFERYDQYGKTKLWYVMDAAPDAAVYMGFAKSVTAGEFYNACKDGSVPMLLNKIQPKRGDSFLIEPGTVHAASGVILTEIQETSDLFLRLYDWGRENNPETAREMNLEEAIDLINFEKYDGSGFKRGLKGVSNLATDSHFIVNSIDLEKPYPVNMSKFASFIVYHCTSGSFNIITDEGFNGVVATGESILIPASLSDFELSPACAGTHILEISVPEPAEEEDDYILKDGNDKNR